MATFTVTHPHRDAASPSSLSTPTSYYHVSGASTSSSSRSSFLNPSLAIDTTQLNDGDALMGGDEEEGDGDSETMRLATTGEAIADATTFMRGHGSYLGTGASSSSIHSSLCGLVHRTNKLISVLSVTRSTRYVPEVGDLVLGRITSVQTGQKRWRVDISSRFGESVLALSSINLPGGIQRRKLESDELQMRSYFKESDWLVAEVQSTFSDGTTALHTRSLRYGKLRNGVLVKVPPQLVRRLKSHFVELGNGAETDLTVGLNGWIWVSKHVRFDRDKAEREGEAGGSAEMRGLAGTGVGMDIDGVYSDVNEDLPPRTLRRISRVSALIQLMASHHLPISDATVQRAYDVSTDLIPVDPPADEVQGHGAGAEAEVQAEVEWGQEALQGELLDVTLEEVRNSLAI